MFSPLAPDSDPCFSELIRYRFAAEFVVEGQLAERCVGVVVCTYIGCSGPVKPFRQNAPTLKMCRHCPPMDPKPRCQLMHRGTSLLGTDQLLPIPR